MPDTQPAPTFDETSLVDLSDFPLDPELVRYVGLVAHDLRAPLAIIVGMLQTVQDHHDDLGPERVRDLTARALGGASRLQEMLESLMDDVTKPVAACRGAIDLNVELDWVECMLHERLEINAVSIERGELRPIWGRRAPIRQALLNAVSNALVHGQREGLRVRVRTEATSGGLRLIIDDNGVGLAPPEREAALTIGRARTGSPGRGLGLSAVVSAAAAHGGAAWLDTSELGGLAVVMELPQRASARAA